MEVPVDVTFATFHARYYLGVLEAAVTRCFGGPEQVQVEVGVKINGCAMDTQPMRLIAPGVAFKITAFDGPLDSFEIDARRLLQHVDLRAIAWINIYVKKVTFYHPPALNRHTLSHSSIFLPSIFLPSISPAQANGRQKD